jgi:transcriptional regulator with XRE-family HTH domain
MILAGMVASLEKYWAETGGGPGRGTLYCVSSKKYSPKATRILVDGGCKSRPGWSKSDILNSVAFGGEEFVRGSGQRVRRSKAKTSSDDELLTSSSEPKEIPKTFEAGIGAEVRRLRKEFDLTVSDLGTAAGISAGSLSKMENGTISPSLATLASLAKALNVPISRLFAETEERRVCSFVKSGQGVRINRRGTKSGHLYDSLGHTLAGAIAVEPYLITLKSNGVPYTGFRHAGLEFIYMLSGKVRYRHGDKSYVLDSGDALFFDAASHHGPEELIKAPMKYLSIIIYPRRT